MTCTKVRKILLESGGPEDVLDEQHVTAVRHAEECSECRRFFRQQEDLKVILRSKSMPVLMPPSVRERFLASVALEQAKAAGRTALLPVSARWKKFVGTAAAVVVFTAAGYFIVPLFLHDEGSRLDPAVRTLVQDHLANQLREHPIDFQTSDHLQLQKWFASRVEFGVSLLRPSGAELLGGRLCSFGGQRVVSVTYLRGSTPITLYIMDGSALNESLPDDARGGGKRLYFSGLKGYNVVLWEEKGLIYGMVSTLEREDLIGLANQSS